MMWFFVAGFVSGVVGTLLFGRYLSKKMEDEDGKVN